MCSRTVITQIECRWLSVLVNHYTIAKCMYRMKQCTFMCMAGCHGNNLHALGVVWWRPQPPVQVRTSQGPRSCGRGFLECWFTGLYQFNQCQCNAKTNVGRCRNILYIWMSWPTIIRLHYNNNYNNYYNAAHYLQYNLNGWYARFFYD